MIGLSIKDRDHNRVVPETFCGQHNVDFHTASMRNHGKYLSNIIRNDSFLLNNNCTCCRW